MDARLKKSEVMTIVSFRHHHWFRRPTLGHMTCYYYPMLSIPELLTGLGADGSENYVEYYNGGYSSVEQYFEQTRMAESGMWGTDFEMSVLAQTVVNSFNATSGYWIACFANSIDKTILEDVC